MFDDLVIGFDRALRTLAGRPAASRPTPGANLDDSKLDESERRHAAGLMRVNHTGEVCAQALYAAQAIVARDPFRQARIRERRARRGRTSRLDAAAAHRAPRSPVAPQSALVRRVVCHRHRRRCRRRSRQPGIRPRDRASGGGASHGTHGTPSARRRQEPCDRRADARRRSPARRRRPGCRRDAVAVPGQGPDARCGGRHALRRLPGLTPVDP